MTTAMIPFGNGLRPILLRALAALFVYVTCFYLATTPVKALPTYDGLWSVLIVTEAGTCDRGYRYPIRITRGVLTNAGDSSFTIAGSVGPRGFIQVTVSNGNSAASGIGRLAGNMGSGSWSGASCSGTWTAERRGS
jgi:hypothetical protein